MDSPLRNVGNAQVVIKLKRIRTKTTISTVNNRIIVAGPVVVVTVLK